MKKYLTISLLAFLTTWDAPAQITNLDFIQQGDRIVITFDLAGSHPYDITVYCSDRPQEVLKSVSGDLSNVQPGTGKRIIWDILRDRGHLVGHISFILKGKEKPEWLPEVVYVVGGTFTMGCTSEQGKDCLTNEKPAHLVTVSSFYIAKTEVTQRQWKALIGSEHRSFKNCDDCPLDKVNLKDINIYLEKLIQKTGQKWRLPTEAEWEYAARGGNQSNNYRYAGSNTLDAVAWHLENSGKKTHPVALKKPNELGLYDMSGNVWEWCQDWYNSTYYDKKLSKNNPEGPNRGHHRVIRGGSWRYKGSYSRVAYRYHLSPNSSIIGVGFRPVLVP